MSRGPKNRAPRNRAPKNRGGSSRPPAGCSLDLLLALLVLVASIAAATH